MPQEQGPYPLLTVGRPVTLPDPMQVRGVTSGIQAVVWNLSAFVLTVQRPDGLSTIPAYTADIVPIKTVPGDLTATPQLSPGGNAQQPGQVIVDWYGPGEVLTGVFPVSLPAQALSSGVIATTDTQFLGASGLIVAGGQTVINLAALAFPSGTALSNFATVVLVAQGVPSYSTSGSLAISNGAIAGGYAWPLISDTLEGAAMAVAPLVTGGAAGFFGQYATINNAGNGPMSYALILTQAPLSPVAPPPGVLCVPSFLQALLPTATTTTPFGPYSVNQIVSTAVEVSAAISTITPNGASGLLIRVQSNAGAGPLTLAELVLPAVAGAHDHIVVEAPLVLAATTGQAFAVIAEWLAAVPTAVAGDYSAQVRYRFGSG